MNAAADPRLAPNALLDANAVLFALSDAFAKLRTPQGSRAASALAVAAACACDVAAYVGEDADMSITDAVRAVATQFANTAARANSPAEASPHEAPASPGVRDETIGTEELARRLKRRARTLRKLAASGVMPARKVGRGYLFNWSAICDWIARKETTKCPSDVTPSPELGTSTFADEARRASDAVRTRPTERRRAARSSATDADRRWIGSIIHPERAAEAAERAVARPPTKRFATERLTEEKCSSLTRNGIHHDGAGLYLQVTGRARSWVLRFNPPGRAIRVDRYLGLGRYPDVSLAQAREKAAEARAMIAEGIDPIARRHEEEKRRQSTMRDRTPAADHAT